MKKCPQCAEEIQDAAIRCRFCGMVIAPVPQKKWYFSTFALIGGLLTVGPFALPLLWSNPRFSRSTKIVITVIVALLTVVVCIGLIWAIGAIMDYYGMILERAQEF